MEVRTAAERTERDDRAGVLRRPGQVPFSACVAERARLTKVRVEVLAHAVEFHGRVGGRRGSRGEARELEQSSHKVFEARLPLEDVHVFLQQPVDAVNGAGSSDVPAEAVPEMQRPRFESWALAFARWLAQAGSMRVAFGRVCLFTR